MELELQEYLWFPLQCFGLTSQFWGISLKTLVYTGIACVALLTFACIIRLALQKNNSLTHYAVLKGGNGIYVLIQDAIGNVSEDVFCFSASIFFILLFYNISVLLPFVEEPTQDLNVTLACALCAVVFIHRKGYQKDPQAYLHHWFKTPLSLKTFIKISLISHLEKVVRLLINFIIASLLFPLEVMGRLSLIFSLAFRLYGNVFGGAMITHLLKKFLTISVLCQLIGLFTGINILVMGFFGFLEGLIQAFVFTLITVNNLGVMLTEEGTEEQQ